MKFPSRLEGGPFDGDSGYWDRVTELPACFWAVTCDGRCRPRCEAAGIHWVPDPVKGPELGGVKYVYDRMDERDGQTAVYLHADIDYDGELGRTEDNVEA